MSDRSHDDGELSDDSIPQEGSTRQRVSDSDDDRSPARSKSDDKYNKDVEAEIRNKLLHRLSEKRKPEHESDDDHEMFTIQPTDAQRKKDLLKKESERDRNKERKRQLERDKERREDRSHGRAREPDYPRHKDVRPRYERSDRSSARHDDRRRRHEDRRVVSSQNLVKERERSLDRDKHRRREREDRDRHEKKHRRRNSPSSEEEKTPEKVRSKRSPAHKKQKEKLSSESDKDEVAVDNREEAMDVGSLVDEVVESIEETKVEITEEITTFTLDSPAGPKKYSKFDSSPEPEKDSPVLSEYENSPGPSEVYSDVEDVVDEEDVEMTSFDPNDVIWEDLTEDQRSILGPETRLKLEGDYQKRLIAQLPVFYPGIMGCRNVEEFQCVNRVDEGTFGVVYRAKDKRTDEIVALKRLKMEKEKDGFPITALREINMLLKAGNHDNIVNVKEILVGSNMDKIFLAMEFVEHDMKSLMDTMSKKNKRFSTGEQKTLVHQLLKGIQHMHKLWILHRDLKTSNLLLSHTGVLKIADFGLAREYGEPLKPFTAVVVTLWYRSPELLLGTKVYSTAVDMWSVGCIMAEFILLKPLFPGRGEIEQIKKIFLELGTPTESVWPGVMQLPGMKQSFGDYKYNQLRKTFPSRLLDESGFELLNGLLRYDPKHRFSADDGLDHPWFEQDPLPVPPEEFPTFPAKSEQHKAPPASGKPKPEAKLKVIDPETAKLMKELNVNPEHMDNFSLKFDNSRFG